MPRARMKGKVTVGMYYIQSEPVCKADRRVARVSSARLMSVSDRKRERDTYAWAHEIKIIIIQVLDFFCGIAVAELDNCLIAH